MVTPEVAEKFLRNLSERGDVSQATNHLILTLIHVMIWTWKLTKSFYHSGTAPISRLLHDPRVLVVLMYSKNSNTINIKFNSFQGPQYFYRLSRSMKMLLLNLMSFKVFQGPRRNHEQAERWTETSTDRQIRRDPQSPVPRQNHSPSSSVTLPVHWHQLLLAPSSAHRVITQRSSSPHRKNATTHTYI